MNKPIAEGSFAETTDLSAGSPFSWSLVEVCEMKQEPYKLQYIPGTIEAEDFDRGCPDDAYYDADEINQGGTYRSSEPVDIETRPAGGYNVGWTRKGEWMAYTLQVRRTANYRVSVHVATGTDNVSFYIAIGDRNISGTIAVPNTAGYQNWKTVIDTFKLEAGKHTLKFVLNSDNLNIDKMVFEEIN